MVMRALGFLTVVGRPERPARTTVWWFPLVGLMVGGAVGAVWLGAAELWSPPIVAALVVVADLVVTGMLHLDGLVDSADGLLPHLDRARRLDVMAEPTVGAFGIGAAVAVLLVRWSALVVLAPNVALLAGLWCAARGVMAVALRTVPYARGDGLAASFGGRGPWVGLAAVAVGPSLALGAVALGLHGAVAVVAAALAGAGVVALGWRRVGGHTGDVLGAACLVAETAGLVVAAIRW